MRALSDKRGDVILAALSLQFPVHLIIPKEFPRVKVTLRCREARKSVKIFSENLRKSVGVLKNLFNPNIRCFRRINIIKRFLNEVNAMIQDRTWYCP